MRAPAQCHFRPREVSGPRGAAGRAWSCSSHGPHALGLVCRSGGLCSARSSPWVGVSPESWGGAPVLCSPAAPRVLSPWVARHHVCARAGLSAPSPRDALGLLGLACLPLFPPSVSLWCAAPAMCWGHGRQAPLTPCRALPRRRVPVGVRLPVALSGSSSPPGKAAERLGGRGRRPRLWFRGPAVPEGLSGPGPASGCLGVSWGVGGVSEPRCRACARGPGPWAETRCVLSLGGLVQVPKMSVTPLTTCGCCL